MVKLRIPKQDITTKTIQYKGKPQTLTVFSAQAEDGTLYGNCEAWGDKTASLKEVMGTDRTVEAEKVEHNAQYNKYNVYFPRGFGGEGAFRGRAGGGGWTPQGYRGKPVSTGRFWTMTADLLPKAMAAARHAMTAERFDKLTPAEVAQHVLPVAQDLVAQYWIEVERNVTFPDGCEPSAAPVDNPSGTGQAGAVASDGAKPAEVTAILAEIATWTVIDPAVKDAMTKRINALPDALSGYKVELHGATFARVKQLTQGA